MHSPKHFSCPRRRNKCSAVLLFLAAAAVAAANHVSDLTMQAACCCCCCCRRHFPMLHKKILLQWGSFFLVFLVGWAAAAAASHALGQSVRRPKIPFRPPKNRSALSQQIEASEELLLLLPLFHVPTKSKHQSRHTQPHWRYRSHRQVKTAKEIVKP